MNKMYKVIYLIKKLYCKLANSCRRSKTIWQMLLLENNQSIDYSPRTVHSVMLFFFLNLISLKM